MNHSGGKNVKTDFSFRANLHRHLNIHQNVRTLTGLKILLSGHLSYFERYPHNYILISAQKKYSTEIVQTKLLRYGSNIAGSAVKAQWY